MNILNIDAHIENIYFVDDIIKKIPNLTCDNCLVEMNKICKNIGDVCENKDKNLIIFAGDLFENNILPTKIMMFIDIIIKLSEISEIIVFKCNRNNKNLKILDDFLQSILHSIKIKHKLYILEKSGEYIYGNIIFKYIDVNDNIIKYKKSKTEKIEILLCDEYKINKKHAKEYDFIICDNMNETVKYNKIREMDNYLVLSLKNKILKKKENLIKNIKITL
jgi:hypothetical protein